MIDESNKSYRIRTAVNGEENINLNVKLDQDYETFEILSLKIKEKDAYRLHSSNYGIIVGRVLANGNFGVPNAKVCVFIAADNDTLNDDVLSSIYPFATTQSQDNDGVKFNLLPNEKVNDCHKAVGTFPSKRYLLDNNAYIEVFDKYYTYTTKTNDSGDYMICGVPVGSQTLHMDLDISDCGVLSQRPRDFVYKGYTIEQFENANQFKESTDLTTLSQIFTQDTQVNVIPFWGNDDQGDEIGITRADISVNFKFETTCVFLGSIASDNASNGMGKKCVPTDDMGAMDELTTGEGTIEMIRKKADGSVEEYQINGNQLIDADGIWCYQIPMNLDYVMTDEYGNMVPTDDPDKGIATRADVRFRISMQDFEQNTDNFFRAKVLVPNNPDSASEIDYNFGSRTKDESFRTLFWNNVYSVKGYIPRLQKSKSVDLGQTRFTGIKHTNNSGQNSSLPYNNLRIKLPFAFIFICAIMKILMAFISVYNGLLNTFFNVNIHIGSWDIFPTKGMRGKMRYATMDSGLCPEMENWYFAPVKGNSEMQQWENDNLLDQNNHHSGYLTLLELTLMHLTQADNDTYSEDTDKDGSTSHDTGDGEKLVNTPTDETSNDYANSEYSGDNAKSAPVCITINTDYIMSCVEMNLAQEHNVINFDFYNDWINGFIYIPRWMRYVRAKRKFLGITIIKSKVKACMDSWYGGNRYLVQQCALSYESDNNLYTKISTKPGCTSNGLQKCHKNAGTGKVKMGMPGIVHELTTFKGQYVYYLVPCSDYGSGKKKMLEFATDIILLGSLNDCDVNGIPKAYRYLSSTSYKMPTNLALTNMDEEGYLYADGSGSVCSGQKATNVQQVANDFEAYSTYSDTYKIEDGDDASPATEAAGIAWNYTGPNQGEYDASKLYQPGGHFLGIGCFNIETNIKTCVNLQRICEEGTYESARKEIPIGFTNEGDTELKYMTLAPTGLISKDDIANTNFRSMFATMNQNKLIAPKESYGKYTQTYLYPNNFDGSISNNIKNVNAYNTALTPEIIDTLGTEQDVRTRTLEYTSNDYYAFRMGFSAEDMKSLSKQQKKFLTYTSGKCQLPQYENSFYFYFGLHDGATALDKFKETYDATCNKDDNSLIQGHVRVSVTTGECAASNTVTISVSEFTFPYTFTFTNENNGQVITDTTSETEHTITGFTTGKYTYKFTDEVGQEVEKSGFYIPSKNEIEGYVTLTGRKSFDTDETQVTDYPITDPKCGYFEIMITDTAETICMVERSTGKWVRICGSKSMSTGEQRDSWKEGVDYSVSENTYKIRPWASNVDFDFYRVIDCGEIAIMTGIVPSDIVDLFLGSEDLKYTSLLKNLKENWWLQTEPYTGDNSELKTWELVHAVVNQDENSPSNFTVGSYVTSSNDDATEIMIGCPESATEYLKERYDSSNIPAGYDLSDTGVVFPTISGGIETDKLTYGASFVDSNNLVKTDEFATGVTFKVSSDVVNLTGATLTAGKPYIMSFTTEDNDIQVVGLSATGEKTAKSHASFKVNSSSNATIYKVLEFPVIYSPLSAELRYFAGYDSNEGSEKQSVCLDGKNWITGSGLEEIGDYKIMTKPSQYKISTGNSGAIVLEKTDDITSVDITLTEGDGIEGIADVLDNFISDKRKLQSININSNADSDAFDSIEMEQQNNSLIFTAEGSEKGSANYYPVKLTEDSIDEVVDGLSFYKDYNSIIAGLCSGSKIMTWTSDNTSTVTDKDLVDYVKEGGALYILNGKRDRSTKFLRFYSTKGLPESVKSLKALLKDTTTICTGSVESYEVELRRYDETMGIYITSSDTTYDTASTISFTFEDDDTTITGAKTAKDKKEDFIKYLTEYWGSADSGYFYFVFEFFEDIVQFRRYSYSSDDTIVFNVVPKDYSGWTEISEKVGTRETMFYKTGEYKLVDPDGDGRIMKLGISNSDKTVTKPLIIFTNN